MRRPLAEGAEVGRRADDPAAEVVLPDPVDHHPRRQRVVRVGDPVGQFQPAAPGRVGRERLPAEHGEEPPRHFRPDPVGVALDLHAGVADFLLPLVLPFRDRVGRVERQRLFR